MRAIQITSVGGPEVLKVSEIDTPAPGAGQILIRQHASGVNFIDVYYREGKYKAPLPFIPGGEGSGVVEELGEGVTAFSIGDAVSWYRAFGSYAEYAVVDAAIAVKVPEGVSFETACGVMMQGITAHYLSRSLFELKTGQTALVHAAAGGVGSLLTQIATNLGVRVLATVSNEEKAKIAREAGASEVILYGDTDFEVEVKRLTEGSGVDVVYDGVGKTTFEQSLRCLKKRGMMALYGAASGPVPSFDLQRLSSMGSLFVTRPVSLDYIQTREELTGRTDALFNWLLEGKLKVHIDKVYPLEDAAQAHIDLESRKTIGKLILSM
ncbi:MAG: quinone oxidoreductase [Acidobacteriaceae bacterium]